MESDESNVLSHIWEDMLINERKQLCAKTGTRVSDWEEENSLLQAIKESLESDNDSLRVQQPHMSLSQPRSASYKRISSADDTLFQKSDNQKEAEVEAEEELQTDMMVIEQNMPRLRLSDEKAVIDRLDEMSSAVITADEDESCWMRLPYEIAQRILIILGDIDMCGYLLMVAKHHPFKPSEVVFRSICESTFPRQTLKKKIQIDRWKLWKNMAIYRPRIRTNGFYCLRTSYTRAPCNDNFWEQRITEFIEVKFYRHMRFYNDGYMLYSMDTTDPWDMSKYLEAGVPVYRRIYEGHYSLAGNDLVVEVILHYCVMRFKMKVLDGDDGYIGKHNMLTIVEHSSVPLTPQQRQEQQLLDQSMNQASSRSNLGIRRLNPFRAVVQQTLAPANDLNRVYYPLPSPCSLRFFRQWHWVPSA
jgi:hypothetical protein